MPNLNFKNTGDVKKGKKEIKTFLNNDKCSIAWRLKFVSYFPSDQIIS